ncbi:YdcF family protein [Candidatus Kaiserbacteria bacterium]|nr:YdcF family protein [Candidatus Kaiserbacteria bacterium]
MRAITAYVKIAVVIIFTVAVILLLVPIVMRTAMHSYTYVSLDQVPKSEVAIIPGASVIGKKPSPILANRADAAIQLYFKGKVGKILVTGDSEIHYDEVMPVRDYLIDAGIPARDIFLDHAGFDTYSSMYRTVRIFGAHSATIVTQDFHLPRALYIARHLGLETYGVVADGQGGIVNGYMREIPASVKALWDLAFYRLPTDLGPAIDLKSDGQATWY